jgi:hypothetical protein
MALASVFIKQVLFMKGTTRMEKGMEMANFTTPTKVLMRDNGLMI